MRELTRRLSAPAASAAGLCSKDAVFRAAVARAVAGAAAREPLVDPLLGVGAAKGGAEASDAVHEPQRKALREGPLH